MTKKKKLELELDVKSAVLHYSSEVAKNGSVYLLVHVLIEINGREFVRKFAIFPSSN